MTERLCKGLVERGPKKEPGNVDVGAGAGAELLTNVSKADRVARAMFGHFSHA